MSPTRTARLAAILWLTSIAAEAQPVVGPPVPLPGDATLAAAVDRQTRPSIAAGDGGFLAVWTETRAASLTGFGLTDVYGARLDAAGTLIDTEPILISTADHEQTGARVAWGGTGSAGAWFVTFRSERTTDFFVDEDVVGVRVAPDGSLLDPQPIVLAASVGGEPMVAGNADGWVAVWPQFNGAGVRGVRGARVLANGTVLDPGGNALWFDPFNTYANDPQVIWGGDRWLVTWNRSGHNLVGMRFDPALQALDPQPFAIGSGIQAGLAFGGGTFFAVSSHEITNEHRVRGARIPLEGPVLDPGGVVLSEPLFIVSEFAPAAAWNGDGWTVIYAGDGSGANVFDFDLKLRQVGSDGQPVGAGPVTIDAGEPTVGEPTVAAGAAGLALAWQRRAVGGVAEDVMAAALAGDALAGEPFPLGVGRPRQLGLELSEPDTAGRRLALFRSQTSGSTRLLAQRLDPGGAVLDPEPVEIVAGPEAGLHSLRAAWNGAAWLFVWQDDTALDGIFGRRFDADLLPLDATATRFLPRHEDPAVAALGATFLIAGAEIQSFHEPQRWLRFLRVGSDGAALDPAPTLLAAGYENRPRATSLGGRWLLVWESQASHDNTSSGIDAAWIAADGTVDAIQPGIDGAGLGDDPDVAVAGGRAFVVWFDNGVFTDWDIEGRSLGADGTLGPVLSISAAPGHQSAPRVDAFDGGWLIAWHDLRDLHDLAERRPDIWAGRVAADGTVLDPEGFAVTDGPFADLGVDVLPVAGSAHVLYSGQDAPYPAGHRILRRPLGAAPMVLFADGFESGDMSAWTTTVGVTP